MTANLLNDSVQSSLKPGIMALIVKYLERRKKHSPSSMWRFSLTSGFTFIITRRHRSTFAVTTPRWLPVFCQTAQTFGQTLSPQQRTPYRCKGGRPHLTLAGLHIRNTDPFWLQSNMMLIECGSSNETQLKFHYVQALWSVLSLQTYRFIQLLMHSLGRCMLVQRQNQVQPDSG